MRQWETLLIIVKHLIWKYLYLYPDPTPFQKRPSLSPSMTGAVWDACKRLNSLSDSNRKACMKDVLRSVSLIRDVLKECNEFLTNDDDDDWDGLLDDDDLELLEGIGEATEEDYNEDMQKEIVAYIESLQHLFEMVFK